MTWRPPRGAYDDVDRRGASRAKYFSGCSTCSVDAGGRAQACAQRRPARRASRERARSRGRRGTAGRAGRARPAARRRPSRSRAARARVRSSPSRPLPGSRFSRKRSITRVASPSSRLSQARRRSSKSATASGSWACRSTYWSCRAWRSSWERTSWLAGAEPAVLADRVEALLARALVVEAGDVLLEHAGAQRAQVGAAATGGRRPRACAGRPGPWPRGTRRRRPRAGSGRARAGS